MLFVPRHTYLRHKTELKQTLPEVGKGSWRLPLIYRASNKDCLQPDRPLVMFTLDATHNLMLTVYRVYWCMDPDTR